MHVSPPIGLRERKKRQTRQAIVRATLELVLEHGYEGATIARIAERADVAPRTIHTIFSGKEGILLWHADDHLGRLEVELRDGTGSTIDRVRAWIAHEASLSDEEGDPLGDLRTRAYDADPHLQAIEYGIRKRAEQMIADAELAARPSPTLADQLAAEGLGAAIMRILLGLAQRSTDGEEPGLSDLDDALATLGGLLRDA